MQCHNVYHLAIFVTSSRLISTTDILHDFKIPFQCLLQLIFLFPTICYLSQFKSCITHLIFIYFYFEWTPFSSVIFFSSKTYVLALYRLIIIWHYIFFELLILICMVGFSGLSLFPFLVDVNEQYAQWHIFIL